MLNKKTLFAVLMVVVLGFSSVAFTDTGDTNKTEFGNVAITLEGKIVDSETHKELPEVIIEVVDTKLITKSDKDGKFKIEGLETDQVYNLKFRHDRYFDYEIPVIKNTDDDDWNINVTLEPGSD